MYFQSSILKLLTSQETTEEAKDSDLLNSPTPRIKTKLSVLWTNLKLTEDSSPSASPTKEEATTITTEKDLQEETTDLQEETEMEAETEAEMEAEITEEGDQRLEEITTTENQTYLANNPRLTSMSPTSLFPSLKPSWKSFLEKI